MKRAKTAHHTTVIILNYTKMHTFLLTIPQYHKTQHMIFFFYPANTTYYLLSTTCRHFNWVVCTGQGINLSKNSVLLLDMMRPHSWMLVENGAKRKQKDDARVETRERNDSSNPPVRRIRSSPHPSIATQQSSYYTRSILQPLNKDNRLHASQRQP